MTLRGKWPTIKISLLVVWWANLGRMYKNCKTDHTHLKDVDKFESSVNL